MYLTYQPQGSESEDPQDFVFNPQNTNTFDAEAIESATGWTWEEFLMNLRKGSVKARRVLLWTFLRKIHRGLNLRDVNFTNSEVKLEYDDCEMRALRQEIAEAPDRPGTDKDVLLAAIDAEIEKARPAPGGSGKAQEPNVG